MMEETTRTGEEHGFSNAQLARVRKNYTVLFVVKSVLGILLLILGGLAVKNTEGQTGTFGPPYYLGAFLVGCPLTLSGMVDFFIFRLLTRNDQFVIQKLGRYACFELVLTVISVFGGFIGTFFAAMFGIQDCDPSSFASHCNYTVNIQTNRSLAIAILVFLIVCLIMCIGSAMMNCRAYNRLAPNNMFKARSRGFNAGQNVYIAGGGGNVIVSPPPERTPIFGGYGHMYRRNDNYSADTQVIVGGQVIEKGRGGFAGAVIHPPENTTVHPPVGYYPQYQGGATNQTTPMTHNPDNVNQLQEQNRLLREQILLQQQQLQLIQQQQQQQQQQHVPLPPEPPSYESCLQDPAQIKFLQQQNAELQNQCQTQQNHIAGTQLSPSAPPM